MIFSCSSLSKSFSGTPVIENASLQIDDKDKTAVVGINGAGKSTLLRLLVGELTPDTGEVVLSRGRTIGYLAQRQDFSSSRTVYGEVRSAKEPIFEMERTLRQLERDMKSASGPELEEMMDTYDRLNAAYERENGYACESEIVGVLKGLGFTREDFDRSCTSLSGGQKTRVALGKILLTKPDCILLDEPTNHLDIGSITWLEGYLSSYPGAVLVVSHDRYFLDRFADHVLELENGRLTSFTGNYTDYAEKKRVLRDAAMRRYVNQQQSIRHQEEVISKLKSFNREKSVRRAESREKMLNKMERDERPAEPDDRMHFTLEPNVTSGKDVLILENLSKSFGDHTLFSQVNLEIHRGERVAVIGNNGTGKTTLLKIITGLIDADEGACTLGAKVSIGYYDQEQQLLTEENTLFDEIQNAYPYLNNTTIRSTLAAFLFTGDDVFKPVSALSGGERGRLSLAKLILSPCNFLILDEPTNHLDMVSKEILEQALTSYTGTVLYVSHDRYFVNKTATRILELTGGRFVGCEGNYDYYLEKRDDLIAAALSSSPSRSTPAEPRSQGGARDWKERKEEQARARRRENEIRRAEDAISALEERDAAIDELLTHEDVYTNVSRLMELNREKEEIQDEMTDWMEKWEALLES